METKAWQLTNVGYKMASVFYKVRAQNTTNWLQGNIDTDYNLANRLAKDDKRWLHDGSFVFKNDVGAYYDQFVLILLSIRTTVNSHRLS